MNAREWSLRHAELLHAERGALADLLLSLAEFDRLAAYRELRLSRQEAEQVAVEIRPIDVVPRRTVVTGVQVPAQVVPALPSTPNVKEHSCSIVELAPTRTFVEPLTSRETRMHVTVSPEFVRLLAKAKAGQSHVQPGATDE